MSTVGLLFMAYGSPATPADVPAYYAHIRGGRPPSAAQIADLVARYRRIGGRSPLPEVTRGQAAGVEQVLRDSGLDVRAYVGMKHAAPFIADVVAVMARDGIRRALGLALAPHYSRMSVATYFTAAADAAAQHGVALRYVATWYDHPGFVAALADRLRTAQLRFDRLESVPVVFTAHSLPERILTWNDPYPAQLRRTAELVAAAAGLRDWRFAYQSASPTGEPWLGPDLLEVLETLARDGRRAVIVCPVGFVADHLEVLYDIDVEAAERAAALGLRLVRAATAGTGADFIAALADLIRAQIAEGVTA